MPRAPTIEPRRRKLRPRTLAGWLRSMRVRVLIVVLLVANWPLLLLRGDGPDPASIRASLWLVLPVALGLALWLGWRIVRPLEKLRDHVLTQLADGTDASATRSMALDLRRDDEFGELARAFDALVQQLAERNRSNERFASDVAHEVKNQLAALHAVGEVLQAGAIDTPRAERLAKVVGDSSRRLDALLSELLDLARAEAGLHSEERVVLDLAVLCRGLCTAMQGDARYDGRVRIHCTAPAVAWVVGVPHRIETALRNLLDNAASFAEGRVDLTLWAENSAPIAQGCEGWAVSIRDDGPGVAADDAPHVFDRFYTSRPGVGTGLGLPLVRAIALAHGGSVALLPATAVGATLLFWLPAATAAVPSSSADGAAVPRSAST